MVVGAGPAGAAAARAAALAGARTLLLERHDLPRYKRCGGGLMGVSAGASGLDLAGKDAALVRTTVDQVTSSLNGAYGWTRRARGGPLLWMVMRAEFDAALVALAQSHGAALKTGVVVTGVVEEPDRVTVTLRSGPSLQARCVVAADGVSSRIASQIGMQTRQVDLGLEGEFAAPKGWTHRLLLDWGPVPGSYAWLFPKGDQVTVGVIGDRAQAAALKSYYASVVARLGLGTALVEGGHHTRVRAAGSPLASAGGRVLLAGDAAGLLEPWTREGISFGLRSGRLAGEAAASGPGGYAQSVRAVLGGEIDAGTAMLAAFTKSPALFHAALGSPLGWREFTALLAARTSLVGLSARAPVRAVVRLTGVRVAPARHRR